jgi:hypothetical protein
MIEIGESATGIVGVPYDGLQGPIRPRMQPLALEPGVLMV